MDSVETDDTGVFSPPISKRNFILDPNSRNEQTNASVSEETDVFSPDVSFRSRIERSLKSPGNEENTPPQTQTPSFTKQLEGIERKGAKRKNQFINALNSAHSEDDSYSNSVDNIFDDIVGREINAKRVKRFQLSADDSKSDDNSTFFDVFKSVSRDKNKAGRKHGFVIASSQESEDSLHYSEIFKSVPNKAKKAKQNRFISPSQGSEDSLQYSDVLVSQNETNVKKKNHFVDPFSQGVDNSIAYSDISVSRSETKVKKNNHFVDPASQTVENSLCYSDISISTNESNIRKRAPFVDPVSQGVENSLHYSDITISANESSVEKTTPFVDPASQEVGNSLSYSNILVSTNESNVEKTTPFVDPASQEVGNSLGYSNILVSTNESNVEKTTPFVDPASQEVGNSLGYSNILVSTNESNVEKTTQFVDPASQEVGSGSSLRYSNISVSQIELNAEKNSRFVDPTSQEIGSSLRYSDIRFSKENRQISRFSAPSSQSNVNDSISLNLLSRSECVATKTGDCSTSSERTIEKNQQTCEKTSSTDFASVRSICIDTIRSSFNISTPPISELACKSINNLTYDVSTSAFCKEEDVPSSINVSSPNLDELKNTNFNVENIGSLNDIPVISTLNASCECTLVGSNSLENANESVTLIESKNESSNAQESSSAINDASNTIENSENKLDENIESDVITAMSIQSVMIDTIPNSSIVPPSHENTDLIESKNETFNAQESTTVNESSKSEESSSPVNHATNYMENSENERDENNESNVTPAVSVQSIMINTVPNSSNEEIIQESVYVPFNPSSLMLSVTVGECASNDHDRDFSVGKNESNQIVELPLSECVQNIELSSPPALSVEKNIKDHDYAAVQISIAEEIVGKPGTDLADLPTTEKITNASANEKIETNSCVEIVEEPVKVSVDISCSKEAITEKTSHVILAGKITKESADVQTDIRIIEEIGKKSAQPSTDIPSFEKAPQEDNVVSAPISTAHLTPNKVEIPTKIPSPNVSTKSTNRSVLSKKSTSNAKDGPTAPIDPVAKSTSQQSSSNVEEPEKSSSPASTTNGVRFRQQTTTSNDSKAKSNYSLRSRNFRSPGVQKNQQSVPSTSAAVFNNASINSTGDGLFNFSNPEIDSFSVISSQKGSYSSRSRNSTSSNSQNTSRTIASRSSVSVFSISKIGRRSTAPAEFKVPQVPKVVPKKKKNIDEDFKHLPSRPNFPKFDFYCNKRFYDYLTKKMEPKYGIRTNNEAVKLAKYISDVVKEVIAMKTGDHHILVEEMKKVLFRRGIVFTHYNFYMFCFDYMPPWFNRKAIPLKKPVKCPPNVEFDVQRVFDSIE